MLLYLNTYLKDFSMEKKQASFINLTLKPKASSPGVRKTFPRGTEVLPQGCGSSSSGVRKFLGETIVIPSLLGWIMPLSSIL
jgi:hypothetical protein